MVSARPGSGVDAERGAQRDQPVAGHDAEARRHAAKEAALDRALNTEQIDRAEGHGQENAHRNADGYDKRIGDITHGGPTPSQRSQRSQQCSHARKRTTWPTEDLPWGRSRGSDRTPVRWRYSYWWPCSLSIALAHRAQAWRNERAGRRRR